MNRKLIVQPSHYENIISSAADLYSTNNLVWFYDRYYRYSKTVH